jgi:hypothetical protein
MKHLILWHKTGLLLVLFLLMITAGCTNTQKVKGNNPGILFITVDDLGWSDTQLFGTTLLYETPNVLRLAERGMKFTNAYSSSPLCSPTRAAIMSGLSPARIGLLDPAGHHEEVRLKSVLPQTTAPPWIQAKECNPSRYILYDHCRGVEAGRLCDGAFWQVAFGPRTL